MTEVPLSEEWRPVVGFESAYDVSNFGQVRSLERMVPYRFKGMARIQKGRMLKPALDRNGYHFVTLCLNGVRRTKRVSCLVLEAFVGPCPDGHESLHFPERDHSNNRVDNLRWGTQKENAADRDTHGTTCRGDRHWARKNPDRFRKVFQERGWAATNRTVSTPMAVLSEGEVREIRSSYRKKVAGSCMKDLAAKYGVSVPTIHEIIARKTWRHVS